MGAVGLLVLFACVFGVYIFHGGDMAPIIAAAPFEFVSIFGAAVGAASVSEGGYSVASSRQARQGANVQQSVLQRGGVARAESVGGSGSPQCRHAHRQTVGRHRGSW